MFTFCKGSLESGPTLSELVDSIGLHELRFVEGFIQQATVKDTSEQKGEHVVYSIFANSPKLTNLLLAGAFEQAENLLMENGIETLEKKILRLQEANLITK